jgi:hypothetical protein
MIKTKTTPYQDKMITHQCQREDIMTAMREANRRHFNKDEEVELYRRVVPHDAND